MGMRKIVVKILIIVGICVVCMYISQKIIVSDLVIPSVGFIADTDGLYGQSFSNIVWNGIQDLREFHMVRLDYSVTESESQRVENINKQAKKNDIVIVPGMNFSEAIVESAKENPETGYIFLDGELDEMLPNIIAIDFREEQAGYLAGVIAAITTKTNTIGFLGGEQIDPVKKFELGYVQGAKAIQNDIEVVIDYTNSFVDDVQSYEKAKRLYEKNCDIVFGANGKSNQQVIEVAKELVKSGQKVWVIGVDSDQYEQGIYTTDGQSVVLTSAVKHFDRAIAEVVANILDGTAQFGQMNILDITTQSVGVTKINPNFSFQGNIERVSDIEQKLATGEIQIIDEITKDENMK